MAKMMIARITTKAMMTPVEFLSCGQSGQVTFSS
jgi:hypothetical protein